MQGEIAGNCAASPNATTYEAFLLNEQAPRWRPDGRNRAAGTACPYPGLEGERLLFPSPVVRLEQELAARIDVGLKWLLSPHASLAVFGIGERRGGLAGCVLGKRCRLGCHVGDCAQRKRHHRTALALFGECAR